jgi:hypothetical protein
MRCGATAGQRERCTSGVWSPAQACATNEVCAGASSSKPGTCQAVADVCRGSAGQAVCDGQGVMYQCNAQGVIDSQKSCSSPQLCQKGLPARVCATCVPSEYRCTDTHLERCDDKGSAFTSVKDCGVAGLCKASAGDCTTAACAANSFTCEGDELRQCNKDQTGFQDVKACNAGLCDKAGGQCDVCVAGTKHCEGANVMTCNAQEQGYDSTPCAGTTKHCVGGGQCVACAADTDCPAPASACTVAHCNIGTGVCEPQPAAKQTACGATRMCDVMGTCVECLNDNDCPDPGACKVKSCNMSSHTCRRQNASSSVSCGAGEHCDGAGKCVQCSSASECSNKTCQTASCTGGQCTWAPVSSGQSDPSTCNGGQVCDGKGGCVECVSGAQCTQFNGGSGCTVGVCQMTHCVGQPKPGSCGTMKVCDAGQCVASCGDGKVEVEAGEACDPKATTNNINCNPATCQFDSPYFACTNLNSACGVAGECFYNYCAPKCDANNPCPSAPPFKPVCANGWCQLQCATNDLMNPAPECPSWARLCSLNICLNPTN